MRYANIKNFDVSNGDDGLGVSLFVQGCNFRCNNCFNEDTWDFDGGELFDNDDKNILFEYLNNPHIKRFSLLGGEPFNMLGRSRPASIGR